MKKLIKTVSLIIACFLVFSLIIPLTSCNKSKLPETYPDQIKDETGKLSDEMKSEIQIAYYNKYGYEPSKILGVCYGVFEDTYCLIFDVATGDFLIPGETDLEVGEYKFRFDTSRQMRVCSGGEFYSLTQAYENGIINDAELTELYVFYNYVRRGRKDKEQLEVPWKDVNLPISNAIKEEIQIAVLTDKYGESYEKKGFDPIDIAVVCYGIFDNAYCVVVWQDAIDIFNSTEVAVGDHTFVFPTNKVINVYFEGEFYSLPKAYETGILDDADIAELYEYYTVTRLGES